MADFLKNLLGGVSSGAQKPITPVEDGAPDPSPLSLFPDAASSLAQAATPTDGTTFMYAGLPRPYTKWYRVWERVYLADFYTEMYIVPFLLLLVGLHLWGSRKNRRKAKSWIVAHGPSLQKEFSSVGFNGIPTTSLDFAKGESTIPTSLLKSTTSTQYISYATGRQNVAFLDMKITLAKRYNPMSMGAESAVGFLFESMPAPKERMEATSFVFDGRESSVVPGLIQGESNEKFNSVYDGFVWAIVHKDAMKTLRDGRYDLSLTATRDHAKLPNWATVMSESAEITDILLTPELQKAIAQAGDTFEALIVSDQPIDQPKTLNEATPKKRISLAMSLPSGSSPADYEPGLPLFEYFLRLPDILVSHGRFRPEVMKKVRNTREEEAKKIKKADASEKAEDRRLKAEKEKKKDRDEKLKNLTPDQQRKFLDKERAQDLRRSQKGKTVRA